MGGGGGWDGGQINGKCCNNTNMGLIDKSNIRLRFGKSHVCTYTLRVVAQGKYIFAWKHSAILYVILILVKCVFVVFSLDIYY